MKEYQGEKAIISLTSWKARINTVGKTIYSLLKQCPGFHIVLVLSEEEFPQKEKELPEDLLILSDMYFEILWIKPNVTSFKKILFTLEKYKNINVPVINADDGLIYEYNYAEHLYKAWLEHKDSIISLMKMNTKSYPQGNGTGGILFPPFVFKEFGLKCLTNRIASTYHDDMYYGILSTYLNINWIFLNKKIGFYNCPNKCITCNIRDGLSARRMFDPGIKTETLMRHEIETILNNT